MVHIVHFQASLHVEQPATALLNQQPNFESLELNLRFNHLQTLRPHSSKLFAAVLAGEFRYSSESMLELPCHRGRGEVLPRMEGLGV